MTWLNVAEIFGPTWQGEGPSTGSYCGFLRLGNCNLSCTWCDTPYTWDWTRFDRAVEMRRMTIDAVADAVASLNVPLLVISGGEPLLQQQGLVALLERLPPTTQVEIETNGTIAPCDELIARTTGFNVSPKLSFAGDPLGRRIRPAVLEELAATGKAAFKFVAGDPTDLEEIQRLVAEYQLEPVFVMPEGTTAQQILTRSIDLAPYVLERGWNLGTRLHVLLFNDQRGV